MTRANTPSDQDGLKLTNTIVGAGVVVRGDIEGPTDLHVHGTVLGKVVVTGLVLEDHAEIDGPVIAEAVVISGHVNGSVQAKAVHVKSTARIEGDVTYTTLQVEAGARLSGRLILSDDAEIGANSAQDASVRGSTSRSELTDSGQELVRMTARLRRAAAE